LKSKGQGDSTGTIRKVASLKAKGIAQVDIAKTVDRHPRTISRMLKTDEAREILKACHMRIVEKAPKAVENITVAVDGFQAAFKQGDKVQAGISWEASKLVTQILGLSPTAQQSIVHQTYINSQTNLIDPVIAELMKKHLAPVIDAEIIESKELVAIPIDK
jgi:hypothetical protein